MKKFGKILITSVLFILLASNAVLADRKFLNPQGMDAQEEAFLAESGYVQADDNGISQIAATIITAFLSLLAIIFVFLIILAGYNWMTASGDEAKVDKAKQTLQTAIIGLIIILGAYAITFWIFNHLDFNSEASVGGA